MIKAIRLQLLIIASIFWFIRSDEGTFTQIIKSEPLYLKVICAFDPLLQDLFFISVLQSRFDDFCQLHIRDLSYDIDLAALFLNDFTHFDYNGNNGAISITSWCELEIAFSLPRDVDPFLFTSQNATRILTDFSSTTELSQFINQLDEFDNITVRSIVAFPVGSKEVQRLFQGTSVPSVNASSDSGDENSLRSLVYVSLVIIFLALTAVVVSKLRRAYLLGKVKHDNVSNIPVFTGSSSGDLLLIGDTIKKRTEQESLASSQTNKDDLESFVDTSNCENSISASEIDRDESAFGDDPSGRVEACASETFDNDESVSSRTDPYPDFQWNSSLPSNSVSPAWSMDTYSQNTSPFSTMAEGLSNRRRWHDEVDDMNLLSLPESFSTCSSNRSTTSIAGTNKNVQ